MEEGRLLLTENYSLMEAAMCSYITEVLSIVGSAKGRNGWTHVDCAVVYYDHPHHVPLDHSLNLDFFNTKTNERVAIELSADSAQELVARIQSALRHDSHMLA